MLVFTNSISTVRRVDGLLHALGIHRARSIHSKMQQRQRLKAIDAFTECANGILVATDVAARGLDIVDIQLVVHFDIARSVQTYIHRSGRTARGLNGVGLTVSIVSPMDSVSYSDVCRGLDVEKLQPYNSALLGSVDGGKQVALPQYDAELVAEAVALARQVFTATFASSHAAKEADWITKLGRDTDLTSADDGNAYESNDMSVKAIATHNLPPKIREMKARLNQLVACNFMKTTAKKLSALPTSKKAAAATGNGALSKRKYEKQLIIANRSWKKDRCAVVINR